MMKKKKLINIKIFVTLQIIMALILNLSFCQTKKGVGIDSSNHKSNKLFGEMDNAMDSIFSKLSLTKKLKRIDKYIYTHSNEHQHLSYFQREVPSKGNSNFYWIQVGISTSERFEVLLNFNVNTKTKKVYYYDPVRDENTRFELWEKQPDKYD